MYKVILMMLLTVMSSSAMAEWVEVDTNYGDGLTAYADPVTIRKLGNIVKIWILYDYTMAQTNARKPYLSIKARWKCDCKEEQIQILYQLLFTANMSEGKVVRSLGLHNNKWQPVVPGSMKEILWKFACEK